MLATAGKNDSGAATDANGYATYAIQHDANGNCLYDGDQVYTYDAWNRMTSVAHAYVDSTGAVQHGQVFSQYGYDGENLGTVAAATSRLGGARTLRPPLERGL